MKSRSVGRDRLSTASLLVWNLVVVVWWVGLAHCWVLKDQPSRVSGARVSGSRVCGWLASSGPPSGAVHVGGWFLVGGFVV